MSAETFYYQAELELLAYKERWPENALDSLKDQCLRINGQRWWVNKAVFAEWRQLNRGRATSRGIGDTLENLFIRCGIKRVVVFVQRELRMSCGCMARREWLNHQLPYSNKRRQNNCA